MGKLDLVKLADDHTWEYRGVSLLSVSQEWLGCNELGKYKVPGVGNILKKYSIGFIVKFLAAKRGGRCEPGGTLFFYDVNNGPMTQILQSVQRAFPEHSSHAAVTNESVKRMLDQPADAYNVMRCASFGVWVKATLASARLILQILINPPALYRKSRQLPVSSLVLLLNMIESMYVIETLHRYLQKSKPHDILLSTDSHKFSRAIVLLARSMNCRTSVIQHGATGTRYAMLPICADKMFAWGEHSRRWFVDNGEDPSKIEIVGCPRMDELKPGTYDTTSDQILMVLNPIGKKNVADYIDLVLKAVSETGTPDKFKLVVKLHPSMDDDRDVVNKALTHFRLRYSIEKEAPIHDLIKQSKVVVSTFSTVGLESIIHGVPAVNVCVNGFKLQLGIEPYNCIFEIDAPEELTELLNDDEKLIRLRPHFDYLINDYFYRLDGLSAQRVRAAIGN